MAALADYEGLKGSQMLYVQAQRDAQQALTLHNQNRKQEAAELWCDALYVMGAYLDQKKTTTDKTNV